MFVGRKPSVIDLAQAKFSKCICTSIGVGCCDGMCCVQVCWEKFTRYFDVEERFVHLTNDCYVLTPEKAIELVDENTIGRPTIPPLLPSSYVLSHFSLQACLHTDKELLENKAIFCTVSLFPQQQELSCLCQMLRIDHQSDSDDLSCICNHI